MEIPEKYEDVTAGWLAAARRDGRMSAAAEGLGCAELLQ